MESLNFLHPWRTAEEHEQVEGKRAIKNSYITEDHCALSEDLRLVVIVYAEAGEEDFVFIRRVGALSKLSISCPCFENERQIWIRSGEQELRYLLVAPFQLLARSYLHFVLKPRK